MSSSDSKEAIILAGGLGTRLKSVITDLPKPMAPVGDVPFLEYLMTYIMSFGITHVVLSVGYKWEMIKAHFGNRYKSIDIDYAVEKSLLGTGGAVRMALRYTSSDHVFIINGDTYFETDLQAMHNEHAVYQPEVTMALKPFRKADRYGTVGVDGNQVISFQEKGEYETGYINGGIYIVNRDIFDSFNLPEKFSIESDLFQEYLNRLTIQTYISEGYFIDIGIPEDYKLAQVEIPIRISL